ncbi:MBL fold metallo-hydrolase [Chitinophaga sp. Ak27]|uniref:MBL fold metallo-hydrolase n=1 Tax=Chitinophaga sp. Ak27 TaxID=2726116 RepID=UPI00145F1BC9|nr:MBL fold metallo-hydrolase [Chitinophaga sp. Ak27]NLU92643.1 RNAse Z [Chitinophaga sp. Ak27]
MKLTISGYSTALFSTWYLLEEWSILMDAGDGLTAALLQKSRKINYVFISHADRDHLTGLLQLNQLNARQGFPVICYPRDSKSFPAMEEFSKRFDPHINGAQWRAVAPGEEIWVKDDLVVIPIRNEHVTTDSQTIRSLSYKVMQVKQKVRPELATLPAAELKQIILSRGKENTTMEVRSCLLGYSGDTPVTDLLRWDQSGILIHEATFLASEGDVKMVPHKNKHSKLEEVMEMVSGIQIQQLVLGHFSSRYDATLIDRSIRDLCDKYAINIPVYRLLPGVTVKDILSGTPLNK